ncbi:MAG: bestrophin family ion channel [Bacteroidota bacterium]
MPRIPEGSTYFTFMRVAHKAPALPILGLSIILVAGYYVALHYLQAEVMELDFKVPGFIVYVLGYVIALLFYFRLGNSYYRWYDGMKGMYYLRSNAESFTMKVRTYLAGYPDEVRYLSTMAVNYYRAMRDQVRHVSDPKHMLPASPGLSTMLEDSYHLPSRVNALIAERLAELYRKGDLTRAQHLDLDRNINRNTEWLSACEVLKDTPPPPVYVFHLRGFILFYALIIPFGFIHELGIWMMLFLSVFFYFYAGMEIISEEVEDPFGFDPNDLPVTDMTRGTEKRLSSILKA